ncbi:MAG: hypothetical protein ACJA1L_003011 [Paracoccaceae bacterium]|jgi:hypothetical protein
MTDQDNAPVPPLPPQDPGGIMFVPKGRHLVPMGDDASGPLAEELLPLVRDAAQELAEDGVPWANSNPDIRRRAARLVKLLDGSLEDVQGRSAGIYLASIWFGAKMEADDRARRDPAAMAEPFGNDLRVGMEELLAALPAFARQFPSALAMEDENREFFVGVEQVAAARAVAFKAREAELLTAEDHADLDADFAAAAVGDDPLAAKAGKVGSRSARNISISGLMFYALGAVSGPLVGEVVGGVADAYALRKSVFDFASSAREEVAAVFEGGPPDIRRAVELNMAKLLQPAPRPEAQVPLVVAKKGGDFDSIQAAINAAPAGARILIRPGTYREAVMLDKPLEIFGEGDRDQIVIMSSNGPSLTCRASMARVAGISFRTDGKNRDSGVQIISGSAEFEDCAFSSNGPSGLGVFGGDSSPTVRRCIVQDCDEAGILVSGGAKPVIEDCEIVGNSIFGVFAWDLGTVATFRRCAVRKSGGAGYRIDNQARALLDGCEATENAGAGVLIGDGGDASVRNCTITNNGSEAVLVHGAESSGTFENNDLRGNGLGSWDIASGAQVNITRHNNLED